MTPSHAEPFAVTRTSQTWAVIDTRNDDIIIEFPLSAAGKAAAEADAAYRNRHEEAS